MEPENSLVFDQLYRGYYNSLLKVIKHKISRHDLAEDILQDAFIKIWISLPNYDESKGCVYTWMAAICRHSALDQLKSLTFKKRSITDQLELRINSVNTERSVTFNPDCIGLMQQVKGLASPYAEVVVLSFCRGYTHSEIGLMLGLPLGTVKSRIRTGLCHLRKQHRQPASF